MFFYDPRTMAYPPRYTTGQMCSKLTTTVGIAIRSDRQTLCPNWKSIHGALQDEIFMVDGLIFRTTGYRKCHFLFVLV